MRFLFLFITLFLCLGYSFGQTKTYDHFQYAIEIPEDWGNSKEGRIVNLFPNPRFGEITISGYLEDYTDKVEDVKDMILAMHKLSQGKESMSTKELEDYKVISFEHIKDKRNWVTKVFVSKYLMLVLTVNCQDGKWEKEKATFLNAIESLKLKF